MCYYNVSFSCGVSYIRSCINRFILHLRKGGLFFRQSGEKGLKRGLQTVSVLLFVFCPPTALAGYRDLWTLKTNALPLTTNLYLHYFIIELFCEGWRCKRIWFKCSAWEAGWPGLSTNYKQCMDLMGQKWYVQVLITNRGIIKPEQLDVCASIMVYIYLDTNECEWKW